MNEIKRTDSEVDKVLNACGDASDRGVSRFPGMTYEDGVRAGIDWLTGFTDDHPLEED